ncbi:three-Cys-motif partner protein TcmP [Fodinibius sediminis]|uniref:Three-Cys-motif partner protein n=1 Tax=Fodinibius sediminis TaxID=1214077 RepID=A0A521DN72_9BACT|nr:three-Cys-motif partner protein TcmP [Fodinibius sediminis]SMO72511.1 three-Cys-motif partner protein [Fodinibius sediminis]
MGYKDLHLEPFDEATLSKLEIFEDYAEAWIPPFVMSGIQQIHIFDLFAGPGYDVNGIAGSPIRILKKIVDHLGNILNKKTQITLHLNEFEPNKSDQKKFEMLKENCKNFVDEHEKFKYCLELKFYNKDAGSLLNELLPIMKNYPSLVFLDQNGIKFISDQYLSELEKLNTTDFLFFGSSSYFKRFGMTDEFQNVLKFSKKELNEIEWANIHRVIVDKLRESLSLDSQLKLHPFSIKKGANIYGIIFGASHPLAVDKFLYISWKKNKQNGEANFDIDDDTSKRQTDLFDNEKLTKIEKFKKELEEKIVEGSITNNKEALQFTYETGNSRQIANKYLRMLKKDGIIDYEGRTPGITYDNVFKKKNIVNYKV